MGYYLWENSWKTSEVDMILVFDIWQYTGWNLSSTEKFIDISQIIIQSDPDLPGPDLPAPLFTGRINFPRFRKLTLFHPDIPGIPIYRAKPFPPNIPVNRGPTVFKFSVHPGSTKKSLEQTLNHGQLTSNLILQVCIVYTYRAS